MSHIFRERSALGSSKRHVSVPVSSTAAVVPVSYPMEEIVSPFGGLAVDLSEPELRESAYEILIAACRSSGARPLTFVSHTDRANSAPGLAPAPSLQRSLTSSAASKVKKALGMRSRTIKKGGAGGGEEEAPAAGKKAATVGELVRGQMRVSEQSDSRIRRALLRIAAGQLGRRMESIVLPLELLQQLKSSDFPSQREYEAWQRRNLKLLEAGLLSHPCLPLDKSSTAPKRLQQIIRGALDKPIETGRQTETMQLLRSVIMSLACRSPDGSVSETCHWADGYPLNLRLYEMLLEACFDVNDGAVVIEEIDDVLELIKKTWGILGINQMLHNLCFLWVLFYHYVATGQVEDDLLFAANNLVVEVEKDAKEAKDSDYSKLLSSTLSAILRWAETRLVAYHDSFDSDNIESMDCVVSLAARAVNILVGDISYEYRRKRKDNVACERIDAYVRSSLQTAFAQKREKAKSNKHSSKHKKNTLPVLSILAQDISQLAFSEKAIFSPILKKWHPLAAGVAVATLHSCFGNELKQFISGISELTPDAIEVLTAADKLEKDLVQIAVQDAVDSEDGGKSIIQEMPPYEAEVVISNLVKSWMNTRIERLKEWVDRNLQQEVWNPRENKERSAPSAVEVLRLVDEVLEAFFLLPIPMHPALLPDLVAGLDSCLLTYISKAKHACGTRSMYIPAMPALTRCSGGSKLNLFGKKDKTYSSQRKKHQVGSLNGENSLGIQQLCVRINSLHFIRTQLDALGKRTDVHLEKYKGSYADNLSDGMPKRFEQSASACLEGVRQISEATAYKVIFHDLSHALCDGLYVGEVSSSRIEPFLRELEQYLEVISSTVHDRVRTRVITDIMKASFDGFMLVLLAGGPSRAFSLQDFQIVEEDFKYLTELFWSNGDGLPVELIDRFAITVQGVLPLLQTDSETLVDQFKSLTLASYGPSVKSTKLPLPPTTGQWSPNDPNTILRVLCYRDDEVAARFLRKTYNLPKKL